MIDKASYIKGKGLMCPFCKSQSIEGGFIEVQAGEAYQEMGCAECQKKWQDVYRLADVLAVREEE
jgi:hypothetical protein